MKGERISGGTFLSLNPFAAILKRVAHLNIATIVFKDEIYIYKFVKTDKV